MPRRLPTSCSAARAARSSRSPRPGRPAILVPYPHATADHQSANAAWMAAAGAAIVIARRGARARERLAARGRGAARRRGAAGGDGGGLARRWPGPTPRARIADEVLAAARDERLERPTQLHFIGIGGAGMSGLALVCAPARRRRSPAATAPTPPIWSACARPGSTPASATTPRTCPRAPRSSSRPRSATTTPSWRWPASAGIEPIHRGELLAELCAREAPDRGRRHPRQDDDDGDAGLGAAGDRRRPGLLRRRRGPGARRRTARAANAGWGEGEWVGRRGRRERRQLPASCEPEIAVVTNVEMDHHSRWGSLAELRGAFAGFAGPADAAVAAGRRRPRRARAAGRRAGASTPTLPGPAELALAVPGAPQPRSTPAPRSPRSSWPASTSTPRRAALARLPRRAPAARAEGLARRRPHL